MSTHTVKKQNGMPIYYCSLVFFFLQCFTQKKDTKFNEHPPFSVIRRPPLALLGLKLCNKDGKMYPLCKIKWPLNLWLSCIGLKLCRIRRGSINLTSCPFNETFGANYSSTNKIIWYGCIYNYLQLRFIINNSNTMCVFVFKRFIWKTFMGSFSIRFINHIQPNYLNHK